MCVYVFGSTWRSINGAEGGRHKGAAGMGNDDDGSGGGSKSTSVWVRRNSYGWVSVRYGW
jgi:hypothetical protein